MTLGYYGKINVYLVDEITNDNALFIFEAEYVNKNGKQGIKIESTVRSASGDDYEGVFPVKTGRKQIGIFAASYAQISVRVRKAVEIFVRLYIRFVGNIGHALIGYAV